MDSLSTLKKILRFLGRAVFGLLVVAFFFSAIYAPFLGRIVEGLGFGSGPYKQPGSVWISEDPEIFLQVSDSHSTEDSTCYILVNDEKIPAEMAVQNDRPWVFISSPDGTTLILGSLKHCSKKEVVFVVAEDYLFDGKYYDKEITLYRQP